MSAIKPIAIALVLGTAVLAPAAVFGQDCSCGYPCDIVLEYLNIFGTEDHSACLTIVAGPGLIVESSADVTLTAGDMVVLGNGFSVSQGGLLTLGIDPLLFCDVTVDGDGDLSNACLDCDDGEPAMYPGATEVCDGLDNDCDGTADEDNPEGGGSCDTGQPGVCAAGTEMCIAGSLQCEQNQLPSVEICDDLDNDCDGSVDEGTYGDSSNGGVDFPDSSFGPELFSPGYPTYESGTVHGKIMPQGDEDWFAISAVENLSDFCLTDDQDEPIKADVDVTPPASSLWYKVCACWSTGVSLCAKSTQKCVTGYGATSATINLEMDMVCGSVDSGYLDIQVTPDTPVTDHSCLEYTVSWAIWE